MPDTAVAEIVDHDFGMRLQHGSNGIGNGNESGKDIGHATIMGSARLSVQPGRTRSRVLPMPPVRRACEPGRPASHHFGSGSEMVRDFSVADSDGNGSMPVSVMIALIDTTEQTGVSMFEQRQALAPTLGS